MTGACIFCGDPVPPTAGDKIQFCGPCLVRQGPPIPDEPIARLARAIIALREYVLSDVLPEVQQRPRYLTSSSKLQETNK